jgi:hypothetical protein
MAGLGAWREVPRDLEAVNLLIAEEGVDMEYYGCLRGGWAALAYGSGFAGAEAGKIEG